MKLTPTEEELVVYLRNAEPKTSYETIDMILTSLTEEQKETMADYLAELYEERDEVTDDQILRAFLYLMTENK